MKIDVVLNLNRAEVSEIEARNEILSTYLCSAGTGTSCAACHPTCASCAGGVCNTCLNSEGTTMGAGAFCMCGTDPALVECPSCHASCGTCSEMGNPEKCTSCKIAEATLSKQAGGSCSCNDGFVYKNYPTTACVSCNPGCPYCVGTSSEACMNSKDLTIFRPHSRLFLRTAPS